ncbi:hypothetical protein [Micromonospora sp. WMMD1082]|uniref:ABC transporter permease subunit n=1 Tax=Micromonospora sp. WMMD1082 TaxID=3016104 RepID=UPI002416AF28|nr:hypothetical protein [Micromonospora sp. WMMD1082]MDG4795518.1 hypothetical protein [Micromonospora sp. WMMD1082]
MGPRSWSLLMIFFGVAVPPDAYAPVTIMPLALLAVSAAVVTVHAGLPPFAQVAPYAAGAYVTARLALGAVDLAMVHLLAAAVLGAVCAGITGVVLVRCRGVVVLLVSMMVAASTESITQWWRLAGIPAARLAPGLPPLLADRAVLLYGGVVVATVTAAAMWLLAGSRQALLPAYRWIAHTGAGAVAGIAGALLIHTQRSSTPRDVGIGAAAVVVLAVAIGGARSLPGAAVGVVIVVVTGAVVTATAPGHAPLLLGLLLGVAVWALPDGVAGLPARLRRRHQPPGRAGTP